MPLLKRIWNELRQNPWEGVPDTLGGFLCAFPCVLIGLWLVDKLWTVPAVDSFMYGIYANPVYSGTMWHCLIGIVIITWSYISFNNCRRWGLRRGTAHSLGEVLGATVAFICVDGFSIYLVIPAVILVCCLSGIGIFASNQQYNTQGDSR